MTSTAQAPWRSQSKNLILEARWIAPTVKYFRVNAPLIAPRHRPGHFVIVRGSPTAERIPLTIADSDAAQGTISLIVQAIGASTKEICALDAGNELHDLAGPLGTPTELGCYGKVALVGGGVGTAVLFPQAKGLKAFGNEVTVIAGARSHSYLILEREFASVADKIICCTDDGSYGKKGFVTESLRELLAQGKIDRVLTAGPLPMMRAVASLAASFSVPTVASLVTLMVDGTGMCGGCRVTVNGQQRFACVHGPEFDAHSVDFQELIERLKAYRVHEKVSSLRTPFAERHRCRAELALEESSAEQILVNEG